MSSPRRTALHGWHAAAGAKMVDFAGWSMPLEYPSGTVTEHRAVRSGCGVFDVSHMGTLCLEGPDVVERLNGLLTNDLAGVSPGEVQYTLLCTPSGGVVDDMLVTVLGPDRVMLVPNAANTAAVRAALESDAGLTVDDRTEQLAILAVQGPSSPAVLERLGLPHEHVYMTAREGHFAGTAVTVSRTGYTGERGYELIVDSTVANDLWEEICVPGVTPCGLGARDTLRTEMGYALHGQDISPDISPVAASLGWAVAWDKPQFVGKAALQEERAAPDGRRLRGLLVTERGVPRPGMSVEVNGQEVGVTTSGTFSPTLRQGVALALLDRSVAVGQSVSILVRGRSLAAVVTKPPFVPSSPK